MNTPNIKADIDVYSLYKPLRNHIKKFNLHALLALIYSVQKQGGWSIQILHRYPPQEVYRWELHIIAREALRYCSLKPSQCIPQINDLIKLVNILRKISNEIANKKIALSQEFAVHLLHPIAHQQLRWQESGDWSRIYQAFKIYTYSNISNLLHDKLGVRLNTVFAITLMIYIDKNNQYNPMVEASEYKVLKGVSDEEHDAYFAKFGTTLENIKALINESSCYDERWTFTFNPLEETPLIQLSPDRSNEYICPFPELLIRRATDSIFFDLLGTNGFEKPYGMAFQAYVGDVLHAQFKGPVHRVIKEQEYWIGKNRKDGVDWIVSDQTGHVMLECKTRRMSAKAKAAVEGDAFDEAIEILAGMAVQHYKNIRDALEGKTHWQCDGKPLYLLIVTLIDWYPIAPHLSEQLDKLVNEKLRKIGLGLSSLQERSPFIVTSISELEDAGQAIAQIGIERFFSSRVNLPLRHFRLSSHAHYTFPDIEVKYEKLFPEGRREIMEYIKGVITPNKTTECEE